MNDSDDIPVFRPRMGGGRKGSSSGPLLFRRAVLGRVHGQTSTSSRSPQARTRVAVRPPGAFSRRAVVKARIVKMTAYGQRAAALHLRYIARDGVEKDGTDGRLYGPDGPAELRDFEAPRAGEKHQFRLILSPEDGAELDLTAYARSFMARVEKDTGRPLEWVAVNHYNTDNPHVHIVIRGVDRRGRELRLDRGYVSHGLRAVAQELATNELGPRRAVEVERQLEREVSQNRMTSLDRDLARRAHESEIAIALRGVGGQGRTAREQLLVRRLEHLQHLRLAERTSPSSWVLAPGWQEKLSDMGVRGDIIKQMHRALHGDPARYQIISPGSAGPDKAGVIYGRVAAKGLADELKGVFFAVVEGANGGGYHVSIDARTAESLNVGDMVSVRWAERRWLASADRQAFLWAKAHGMLYVAEAHGRELYPESVALARSAAHTYTERMTALERLGAVTDLGGGRWRFDAQVMAELEVKQRAPGGRFVVRRDLGLDDQVRYPGPVGLDRLRKSALAVHGLGALVREALSSRDRYLQSSGIDPASPRLHHDLRRFEFEALGRRFEGEGGPRFLSRPPPDFKGRVTVLERLPSGAQYAMVGDGVRFALVPASNLVRGLEGQTMSIGHLTPGRKLGRDLTPGGQS